MYRPLIDRIPGAVSAQGGVCPGVSAQEGVTVWHLMHAGIHPPATVDRMTDTCKNITLPQTSFAGGNNTFLFSCDSMEWITKYIQN